MRFFHPDNRSRSDEHERIYAVYELWFTVVDVAAAVSFVVGSLLFFFESTTFAATWLFLLGSTCFALKPSIRLAREWRYWRMGKIDKLAERERG
ncbi:N-acetyl-gamma-glutamyl-phosphate reductase [Rhodobacteraceae bacterium 2CG4]|uniref:N-acetyl-gamma-glutamyl-phosphate reductase n=1 Tax=Halovulum marinum TaxID=2662447 RepID=A0A6L5Z274_9RHOB|nr:YrhK family protein [Halovulum marinum]MSU90180.1 N-acetyl-gamma-glutamyl-phosphate reductase [Halovulum marinum]